MSGGFLAPQEEWNYTYYAHDANGQTMAVYDLEISPSNNQARMEEHHIYGASRLGMLKEGELIYDNGAITPSTSDVYQNTLGDRRYELTNHLGNVQAVVTDRTVWNTTDANYEAVVVMTSDYYPFGMQMPERHNQYGPSGDSYRYAYNGMEVDNEVSGNGNSYTTEFRQYDSRLGRWKSLDPLKGKYPSMSPYQAFNNNPIFFVDPRGLEGDEPKRRTKYESGTTSSDNWCTNCGKKQTDRQTREVKGVGGFTLHIPDAANSKQVGTIFKSYEPTEEVYKTNFAGIEEGEVRSFIGPDGDKYTARFHTDGKFDYYYSGDKKYVNKRISARDILSTKLGQSLTYFSEVATSEPAGMPDPPSVNYNANIYATSFKLDNETFDGTIEFNVVTDLRQKVIKGNDGKPREPNAIEFTTKSGTVSGTEMDGWKFVIYSYKSSSGTHWRYDKLINITFADFNEYKRFVRYIVDNYNISDDNGFYVPDNPMLPSEILNK